jgi:hypothetical protein
MTPHQQSILSRYGISNPPEWSGMSGQGADTLYSVGGKWMKAGQTHPSGYTIGQYDPKSKALGMSIHGVNIPVGMKSSTIQNFEAPYNPYEDPTASLFEGGAMEALGKQQASLQKKIKELRDKIAFSGSDYQGGNLSDADREFQNNIKEYYNAKKMLEQFKGEQDYQ